MRQRNRTGFEVYAKLESRYHMSSGQPSLVLGAPEEYIINHYQWTINLLTEYDWVIPKPSECHLGQKSTYNNTTVKFQWEIISQSFIHFINAKNSENINHFMESKDLTIKY